jgi:glucose/arabinose dehydrogenase
VATGLNQPLWVTTAGDGTGDLYVVEQRGVVRAVRQGRLDPAPFLDITGLVRSTGNEQGLLGLAFHPAYARNGYFYVDYTDAQGDTMVARYRAAPGQATANPTTAATVLAFKQPFPNHNGGMLLFGPDGKLWIGTGDGGGAGDTQGNGQNRASLLGKMLRIDVDAASPYSIPPGNPFVGQTNARPEIWALGLRNPWRYSFDRATGDLFIADVGQNSWEEVNMVPAGASPPLNFGWNLMEGAHCFPPTRQSCPQEGLTLPITEYRTGADGCSVTGGYVYRGRRLPALVGRYVFGDYCKGTIWALERTGSGAWTRTAAMAGGGVNISSFGEDADGELYVTGHNTGTLYRVVAR